MPRIVSIYLAEWPIRRFLLSRPEAGIDPAQPFVLVLSGPGGGLVSAANRAARALDVAAGDRLADARARIGPLQVQPADPAADLAALRRLGLWAMRYAPLVACWGEAEGCEGLFLDTTGADHLFGGEAAMLADIARRLRRFGLPARLAVAATPGGAWALSRYHASPAIALAAGEEAAALAPLPVEALRLDVATAKALRRLGLRRIGDLLDKPRAPFASRFRRLLLLRLDQALGRRAEALDPVRPPPLYRAVRQLLEPIGTQQAVLLVVERLMADLEPALTRDGVGARMLRLDLHRVDGGVRSLDIGLALPTREPARVARLAGLRLERLGERLDAGFGFEAAVLGVEAAETMAQRQADLAPAGTGAAAIAPLVEGLRQRLGPERVRRLAPCDSHLPERAETTRPWQEGEAPAWPAQPRPRPVLLLERPEPVEFRPGAAGRLLRWRGGLYAVAALQPPERIAGEWWHPEGPTVTRDHVLAEDEAGRRLWLMRPHDDEDRWFVQGVFA